MKSIAKVALVFFLGCFSMGLQAQETPYKLFKQLNYATTLAEYNTFTEGLESSCMYISGQGRGGYNEKLYIRCVNSGDALLEKVSKDPVIMKKINSGQANQKDLEYMVINSNCRKMFPFTGSYDDSVIDVCSLYAVSDDIHRVIKNTYK